MSWNGELYLYNYACTRRQLIRNDREYLEKHIEGYRAICFASNSVLAYEVEYDHACCGMKSRQETNYTLTDMSIVQDGVTNDFYNWYSQKWGT